MNEHSLHSEIKNWCSRLGDRFEARVGNFIVDIARGDLLIEIQTKNFYAIKLKLASLIRNHQVRLVYPIPEAKWIVTITESNEIVRRRRSPRKGKLADLFYELVSIPTLFNESNFSMEVLMIDEEEVRCDDGKGSWRRRGLSIRDRRLIDVKERFHFGSKEHFLRFLPSNLGETFTNRNLGTANQVSLNLARKISYCLEKMGTIRKVGKRGRALVFQAN
ncbi:MAG: hypothetical protein JSV64_00425 [Candidatus Bathyarchaeota archaeon]|jgi:hypothetical protein|nr:MAG: hypothetical protein JSV64_00425 [Candidatus Bathyarchaeota archaeon]